MNAVPPVSAGTPSARSARFHLWRSRKDRLAQWCIATGGIAVIGAVVLIFFYLLYVVSPLFVPAGSELSELASQEEWADTSPVYVSIEEQQEIGLRIADSGQASFFHVQDGSLIENHRLPLGLAGGAVLASDAIERNGLVAVAGQEGGIILVQHNYETSFEGGVETRLISPQLSYPYGEAAILSMPSSDISAISLSDNPSGLLLAAADRQGLVKAVVAAKYENFLTGEFTLEPAAAEVRVDFQVTALGVSGDHKWLYLGDSQGRIHRLTLPRLELDQTLDLEGAPITTISMLLGGISVLAGDAHGRITQLFPVRDQDNEFQLRKVRQYEAQAAAIVQIVPEQRRKGFLALDAENGLGVYHSTSGKRVHFVALTRQSPQALALSPRANGLLIESDDHRLSMMRIDNEHPEISWSVLWQKVWYENYETPEYVWQSSAATNEFEPKFSLTPLVFGTIKAALYAMLFAVPLALMGAVYTAYFMAPGLRKVVKPTIEIMAALPTVILGFMAGLWLAPYVEENLTGIFMLLLVVPAGLLISAWLWHVYDGRLKSMVPEGWEPVIQVPVLVGLGYIALTVAGPVQQLLFGGDLKNWLNTELGISYDQRNALVVGFAMGFAVIPTIYSIAEDAIFGVPKSLSNGSLALGATPWQSMVRVVLPTASPGIFSALMIGLGRAVGETMIVLMATGNTPVMDWNLFEGMRTLAANIAVEMPESEVGASHYRILFLAALVLFMFTFFVNTGAELIRQHLREKYSSL